MLHEKAGKRGTRNRGRYQLELTERALLSKLSPLYI